MPQATPSTPHCPQHAAFPSRLPLATVWGRQKHLCWVYFQLKTMRQEDYMKTISDLELHYQEFIRNSQGSEMFGDDDKRKMQTQFTDAQKHYQTLVIQLPGYPQHQTGWFGALSLCSHHTCSFRKKGHSLP